VNSIDAPEDDPAVARLKGALAKKAEMDILGYNYQQERTFDALQEAAGNTGTGGQVMGAGIGLGMGLGMGPAMGGTMSQAMGNIQPAGAPCPKCRTANPAGAKFCTGCGAGLMASVGVDCPACKAESPLGAAFCVSCGTNLKLKCTKCATDLPAGSKFCLSCGTPVTKA